MTDHAVTREMALRNLVQTASNALAALETGALGLKGATGALLERTLTTMRELLST